MSIAEKRKRFRKWLKEVVRNDEHPEIEVRLPLHTKFKYNRLGFTDFEYVAFDLAHNDPGDYISMRERCRLEPLNGKYARMLGRKLQFERAFAPYVHVPHVFCWIKDGRFIDMDDPARDCDVLALARAEGRVIAKPTQSSGGGAGVFEIGYRDGGFCVDGKSLSGRELTERLNGIDDYMLVAYVAEHEYAKSVFPATVNTIRVVTGIRRDRRAVDVLFAGHRFGSSKSAPTDNVNRGGYFCQIDEETGVCRAARNLWRHEKLYAAHPETGMAIEGLRIPGWDALAQRLKEVHMTFPFYELLAWDVVIDPDGEHWVIEVNRGTDLMWQIRSPMRNDKLGRFMGERGLLDKR